MGNFAFSNTSPSKPSFSKPTKFKLPNFGSSSSEPPVFEAPDFGSLSSKSEVKAPSFGKKKPSKSLFDTSSKLSESKAKDPAKKSTGFKFEVKDPPRQSTGFNFNAKDPPKQSTGFNFKTTASEKV